MSRLYSARKKLIHTMSLDIDRPITRAVVVGCAIFATRKLFEITHVANIKSTFLCNPHAKTRKLWKRSAGLPPLEAIYLSIKFSSPSVAALRAPAEMPHCTLFGSPVCRHDVASHSRRAYHQERRRH